MAMKTRDQPALERHPALEAWLRIAPGGAPVTVERLKRTRLATFYRMHGAGDAGGDVIAMRCRAHRAARERAAYQRVLARLEIPSPRLYGSEPEEGGEFHWVFVEDASGRAYLPQRPEDRVLAGMWLATLHGRASESIRDASDAGLPDAGPDQYAEHLRAALAVMQNLRGDAAIRPLLPRGSDDLLNRLTFHCATASAQWEQVRQLCDSVPRTVIHGDFAPRNLRIGAAAGEPVLRAFDWEDAAWAPPALDLIQADPKATCDAANPDAAEYLATIRRYWTGMDAETIRRLGEIGRLFWYVLAIRLDACAIAPEWVDEPVANLRLYFEGLAEVLTALGWKV